MNEQHQQSLDKVKRYLELPGNDDCFASKDTKADRDWLMNIWDNDPFHASRDPTMAEGLEQLCKTWL